MSYPSLSNSAKLLHDGLNNRLPIVHYTYSEREGEVSKSCTPLCAQGSRNSSVIHENIHICSIGVVIWITPFYFSGFMQVIIPLHAVNEDVNDMLIIFNQ